MSICTEWILMDQSRGQSIQLYLNQINLILITHISTARTQKYIFDNMYISEPVMSLLNLTGITKLTEIVGEDFYFSCIF